MKNTNRVTYFVVIVLYFSLSAMETHKSSIIVDPKLLIRESTLVEFKTYETILDNYDLDEIVNLEMINAAHKEALTFIDKILYHQTASSSLGYQSLKVIMQKLDEIEQKPSTITQKQYLTQEKEKITAIEKGTKEQRKDFYFGPLMYDKENDVYYSEHPRRKKTKLWLLSVTYILKDVYNYIEQSQYPTIVKFLIRPQSFSQYDIDNIIKPLQKLACVNKKMNKIVNDLPRKDKEKILRKFR